MYIYIYIERERERAPPPAPQGAATRQQAWPVGGPPRSGGQRSGASPGWNARPRTRTGAPPTTGWCRVEFKIQRFMARRLTVYGVSMRRL